MHSPGIPTAPHQKATFFRVRTLAAVTIVPLHPYLSLSLQKPHPPLIEAILAGLPLTTLWAALPIPRCPPPKFAQPLDKSLALLYDVHGLFYLLVLSNDKMIAQPSFFP